jgi:thiamine pyrophosphokinase
MTTGGDALLLAAGRVVATPALRRSAATAELVVAADGGLRHARSLGVHPHLLVGDLDSVDEAALRRWPDVQRVVHPRDKDALDLELALQEILARGATRVLVAGALGDRLDQSLAGIAIAERVHRGGTELTLDSGDARVLPLRPGETRHDALEPGTVLSVIATLPGTRVSLTGARWTLDHHTLEPGLGLGVSNVSTGDGPSLTLHEGGCLLVVPRLDTPAAATIWGAHEARIQSGLVERDPALADLVRRVAYDEVFERPELDLRTRELLALAHLVTIGSDLDLRTHLIGALRAGATPSELRGLVLHAAMFVGFPRALAAADALRDVLGDGPAP